jgi:hypothetical protein
VPGGDSTGERRWLRQARWGGEVLTEDGRRRWGEESGPAWRRSKAAAELRWPGRASMSHAAGGGDGGGEVRSKRGRRWGAAELTGLGETMAWRREDGATAVVRSAGADKRPRKERRGRQTTQARAREGG